jgi:PleD family two-component response regulator
MGLISQNNHDSADADSRGEISTKDSDASGRGNLNRQPSLLIVDDETPIRLFIKSALERWGYEVQVASGGNEAKILSASMSST